MMSTSFRSNHNVLKLSLEGLQIDLARDNFPRKSFENPSQYSLNGFATTKIQCIWRGHQLRKEIEKKHNLLSYKLLKKAKLYVNHPIILNDLPRACNGATPVYLPLELPVVLKESGSPENQNRFDQMKRGRDICERNGYEHLVIPPARVYGNFIIERRLPIRAHRTIEQIGLYIENRERFTCSVQEFVGFLCQSRFKDITGNTYNPYGIFSKTPLGRYDNIALYLEEDLGKIGLIDLEQFYPLGEKEQKKECYMECRDAVHLFPLHLEEILSAAKKFDVNVEDYRKQLIIERDEALKRFEIAYEGHLDFVRIKGVTLQNPLMFERMGLDRIEQLKPVIEGKIRQEHEDVCFRGCLGENPDETLFAFIERALPPFIEASYNLIHSALKSNMESFKKAVLSSNGELLSLRTVEFGKEHLFEFIRSTSPYLDMMTFSTNLLVRIFSIQVLDMLLKEMERERRIYYYNPKFGYGKFAVRCVFL